MAKRLIFAGLLNWSAFVSFCDKYLAPSLLPFIIAHMVHQADPSFSETLVQAEFNKSALEFTEQLDRATRGRFTLSHVWKK